MPNSSDDQNQSTDPASQKPAGVNDGPPQTRENPEGASPDRQIAQDQQQSTGQGMGQS